jgi:predicted  nucleic acid-binding Zn-ribbon protein
VPDIDALVSLQDLDNAIEQIAHRSARLPERAATGEATVARDATRTRRAAALARAEAATARIEALEQAGVARDEKKARLERQLRTVIAPREAEALMAEIATLDAERSDADDEELAAIDVVETAEAEVGDADALLVDQEAAARSAATALAEAEAALARERDDLVEHRAAAAGRLDPSLLTQYEKMRASFNGIAISRLTGDHCGACHLDISRTSVEAIKAAPSELHECEQCGRWLVA